ncbi:MAG: LysE family transporter, partial [Acidobacteriota bacterium]
MAPLITDAPVIVLAVWISSALPAGWLAALGVAGGCFALWLGADIWRRAGDDLPSGAGDAAPRDLLRGAFVNLLSPHPWLFWMTIGAPILIEAVRRQSLLGLSFLGGFYLCLVGLLALIAWLVARAGRRLGGVTTRRIVRACALLLVALGAWLIWHHGGRVLGERGEVPKAISPADVAWNEEAGHDE